MTEEEIAKGFSAIEINGVTFHSVQEMLVYMNNLRKENAELKAQIPKWHDLRKDPKDLPTKENVTIRCVLNNGNEVICETDWYSPTEDEIGYGKIIIQFYCNDDWIDTNDVIAWCELPKFEEKK